MIKQTNKQIGAVCDTSIVEEEGLYNPCGENKGTDQLHDYRKADLRPCFRMCKKPVFS